MVRWFKHEAAQAVAIALLLGGMALLALSVRERPLAQVLFWLFVLGDGAAWSWAINAWWSWRQAKRAAQVCRR